MLHNNIQNLIILVYRRWFYNFPISQDALYTKKVYQTAISILLMYNHGINHKSSHNLIHNYRMQAAKMKEFSYSQALSIVYS